MAYGFFKIIKGLVIREEGTLTPKEIDVVPGGSASTKTTVTSSQTADRTLTLPDATDTLVGKVTTDTLQNKTLDTTNDINVKSQAHFIISDETDITKKVQFNVANVGTGSTQTLSVDGAGNLLTHTNTQTVSNKTLDNSTILTVKDANLVVQDDSDTTKQLQFQLSGLPTSTTATLAVSGSGTIVTTSAAQALINKSIDADLNTITNIDDGNIKAGAAIDATKIADGSVSSTEFQYLSGVTSDIQTQLNTVVSESSTNTFTNKTFDADGTGNVLSNIDDGNIKAAAAIDTTKLADGSVSNTEFQFINTLSSNAQTQLDGKVDESTLTTKGDTFVATGASTVVRQPVGSDYSSLVSLSAATNGIAYLNRTTLSDIQNLTIEATPAASALTINIYTSSFISATTTTPILVAFRNPVLTPSSVILRAITGSLSMVISSGSTLGQTSGQPSYIWVYLIDNAGTPEIAVSHSKYAEDTLVSTTAEGGAGGADSATTIYSTTSRTNVPIRLVGYILNTQTTAGTWATLPSKYQLAPFLAQNSITSQTFTSGSGTYITPAGCIRIRVRMIGAGGGGGGSGTADGTVGGTGGDTTFGSRTAGGGVGAVRLLITNGGATSGSGGTVLRSFAGGKGGPGAVNPTIANGTQLQGGYGGQGFYSGGGVAGGPGGGGNAATAFGGGGSGAGTDNVGTQQAGAGGGAGGFYEILYNNPDASYSYSVGAAGTGGGAGTGGRTGGAAASGAIHIIEEYY